LDAIITQTIKCPTFYHSYKFLKNEMATLYIVPTPIGNLEDITLRAIRILKSVEFIACEDTRVARKLLSLLGINFENKRFISFFEPRESQRTSLLLSILEKDDVALISDSGTPLISDPGYKLVNAIKASSLGIKLEVLPGPTSITTALVKSGQPTHKFFFLGFLPNKNGQKQKLFEKTQQIDHILPCSFIAFESPHRIVKTLKLIDEIFARTVKISVCKELTKLYEQEEIGSASEILALIQSGKLISKGEFVIIFSFTQVEEF
jgi:16S rRNA (cytidine1402-2'-O)-methyltransferase